MRRLCGYVKLSNNYITGCNGIFAQKIKSEHSVVIWMSLDIIWTLFCRVSFPTFMFIVVGTIGSIQQYFSCHFSYFSGPVEMILNNLPKKDNLFFLFKWIILAVSENSNCETAKSLRSEITKMLLFLLFRYVFLSTYSQDLGNCNLDWKYHNMQWIKISKG